MSHSAENGLSLLTSFHVSSADTELFGRLRPGALVNFLIQSAILSADSLGFGYRDLKQKKLFWVLSRLHLEILRPLKWKESLEVETWPRDIEKILYIRDFLVRDEKGEIAVRATSGWLAVDMDTRRPKLYQGLDADRFVRLRDKKATGGFPERLDPMEKGKCREIQPSYFDIDLNRHVTATRYIDWMIDTFPLDLHARNYPKHLSMNYLRETLPGETIRLHYKLSAGSPYHFEGIHAGKNTVAFRGKLVF